MDGKFQIFGTHLKAATILLHLLCLEYIEAESKEKPGEWDPQSNELTRGPVS
jgi:hypothetical protein